MTIAREIKDRQSQGNALGNLGNAYDSLGDYPKAIEYHQQVLAIAQEIKDRQGQGTALNNLGLAFYKQGNFPIAESNLIEGMKVLESLRGGLKDSEKVSIFDTQGSTYRILQQVYIAQNKTDAALEIAEKGRARAFVELLTSRLQTTNSVANIAPQVSVAQIKQIAQNQKATLVQYSIIY
ncbi:MAG: tetratricopeptide repeat protein, partial [Rhizonema sp. PD38]|nr:tetratricopeptide repeat protein [Rhizonema sp. PD38]